MTTLTPRQRHFIAKARDAYQSLIDGDMDPLACVPHIREQLAKAEVDVGELDPLGQRSASAIDAELTAAYERRQREEEQRWQQYEQDRQAAIGPRHDLLSKRKARLEAILEARKADDWPTVARIEGRLDRIDAERRDLHDSHATPRRER